MIKGFGVTRNICIRKSNKYYGHWYLTFWVKYKPIFKLYLWKVNQNLMEENIMNYRISKKIYKRADFKLKSFIAANHDKRTTYDIAKEEMLMN